MTCKDRTIWLFRALEEPSMATSCVYVEAFLFRFQQSENTAIASERFLRTISAAPSPFASVNFQISNGAATYNEPSNQHTFSGTGTVGKHRTAVEVAVAINVFQSHGAMRPLLALDFNHCVRVAGLRRVQATAFIEVGTVRSIYERLPSDVFDCESARRCTLVAVEFRFGCGYWNG